MSDDDVIDLAKARSALGVVDDASRVLRRKRDDRRPFCLHRHYAVSMRAAEVECSDCGAPLDPWTVLRDLATKHEHTWVEIAQMGKERARLRAEIETLKQERNRLRKLTPKQEAKEARLSMDPTPSHGWRVLLTGKPASLWMCETDARAFAKKRGGSVEEYRPTNSTAARPAADGEGA